MVLCLGCREKACCRAASQAPQKPRSGFELTHFTVVATRAHPHPAAVPPASPGAVQDRAQLGRLQPLPHFLLSRACHSSHFQPRPPHTSSGQQGLSLASLLKRFVSISGASRERGSPQLQSHG